MNKRKTEIPKTDLKPYQAIAKATTTTVKVYFWTCPECQCPNRVVIWPDVQRRSWGLRAKCGRCHLTKVLVDVNGHELTPDAVID